MSRVLPFLVRNSLDLQTGIKVNENRSIFVNLQKAWHRILSSLDNCRCSCETGLAETFSVTGGIIAITGFLIASFGIFPKNQVKIKLISQ